MNGVVLLSQTSSVNLLRNFRVYRDFDMSIGPDTIERFVAIVSIFI